MKIKNAVSFEHDLNTGALSWTWAPNIQGEITAIDFHFAAAHSETITVTRVSGAAATKSTVIKTHTLSGGTDYTWEPAIARPFMKGDSIKVQCTAASATCIVGITIFYNQLSITPASL